MNRHLTFNEYKCVVLSDDREISNHAYTMANYTGQTLKQEVTKIINYVKNI